MVHRARAPTLRPLRAAQFDRHIYHATTRLMGLYHAQRQNRTSFGEVDGDGYLPPLDVRNHPIDGGLPVP